MALSFKSRSFSFWQHCLFFAHTSLSFTFTWGVAYNYCLVNSFFCNIHDIQRQRSSKRSRGGEGGSLQRMTNSHQGGKKKEKKKEYLTKRKTTKNQSPTVPPSSVTQAVGDIVQVILCCRWSHISATLFGSTVLFVKSFTIKMTTSNITIWFPIVANILHNIKAVILSIESGVKSLTICWVLIFLHLDFENACIIFRELYKLDIRN